MNITNLFRRGAVVGISFVSLTLFPSGCGSDAPPASITLSGTLEGARAPLAGYKFKCVTLTNPAFSGTATADSTGAFSLDFSASGVPFGCFVLNASDVQVATAFFTMSTTSGSGQTITIGGSTSLGTVTVDTTRGTATAAVAASLVTGSPAGLDCPLGFWTGTVGPNTIPCTGDTVTLTLWIGKDSAGNYVVSQSMNPVAPATCGTSAFAGTGTITYASNVLTYGVNFGHSGTAEATVASDCSNIQLKVTQTGCGSVGLAGELMQNCTGTPSSPPGLTAVSNFFPLTKP